MAIYIIEAVSTHKLWYAIETDKKKSEVEKHVGDLIKNGDIKDFGQTWQGEHVETVTRVGKDGYIKTFDVVNKQYKTWTENKKLNEVNRIDGPQPEEFMEEDEI